MRFYSIAMLVHVLGLIAVFAGFAIQHRAAARLRRAVRYDEARLWAELLTATRSMVPSGVLMLLLSGGYLLTPQWPHLRASSIVAIVAVLFIAVAALAVVNPGFAAINRSVSAGDGALSAAAIQTIGGAGTWAALFAANGVALGTIWLMTARPALVEAVLVVLLPAIIGLIVGARMARGAPHASPGAS
jgi:hypothetical protein